MFTFVIAAWVCAAAWIYLLAAHGHFWTIRAAQPDASRLRQLGTSAKPKLRVAAVIPARNEADVIGQAVALLLSQAISTVQVFVVDDNSSDGTAEAARAAGTASALIAGAPFPQQVRDRLSSPPFGDGVCTLNRVSVIPGRPLPPGWTGKLWAMQQGIEAALRSNPDYLLLTDADIEHAPGSLRTLIAIAEDGGYDLVSFMVKLHCESVADKLLIPAFVFFFFMLYPPEWVRAEPRLASKRRTRTLRQAQGRLWGTNTAGAAGGCMLLRPAALERIGGIAAIRQEIIDDCALARAVKHSGGKVWLGLESCVLGHDFSRAEATPLLNSRGLQPAPGTRSLRPYGSFARIERMIARTAFNQLHHSVWLLLGTVMGMLLLYVMPIALMVSGSPRLAFVGAFAYGLMTFAYMPMVRFYRLNPLWALALPFAGVFYTAATIHSAVKYWTGRGGDWKGRAQDAGELRDR